MRQNPKERKKLNGKLDSSVLITTTLAARAVKSPASTHDPAVDPNCAHHSKGKCFRSLHAYLVYPADLSGIGVFVSFPPVEDRLENYYSGHEHWATVPLASFVD